MKKISYVLIGIMAATILSSCGGKTEAETPAETQAAVEETTTRQETTVATTEATTIASTEATTEATTEAKTEPQTEETQEAIEIGDLYTSFEFCQVIPWIRDEVNTDDAFSTIPDIGKTKKCNYFIEKAQNADGSHNAYQADFKTVSLPKWAVYKIPVDPALFPEDESKVYYPEIEGVHVRRRGEDYVDLHDHDLEKGKAYGTFEFKEPFFMDEHGIAEDGCIDLSDLYPGSLTRKSKNAALQIWQGTLKEELDTTTITDEKTGGELFCLFYPYEEFDFGVDDYYYCLTNGEYTYYFINIYYPGKTQDVHWSKETKDYAYNGACLVRTKGKEYQGFIYLSSIDPAKLYANYVLNVGLEMMDMDKITEDVECKYEFELES